MNSNESINIAWQIFCNQQQNQKSFCYFADIFIDNYSIINLNSDIYGHPTAVIQYCVFQFLNLCNIESEGYSNFESYAYLIDLNKKYKNNDNSKFKINPKQLFHDSNITENENENLFNEDNVLRD